MTLAVEQMTADVVGGKPVDADALVRVNSEARRLLETLRVKAAKNTPAASTTLAEYLASKVAEKAAQTPEPAEGS